VYMDGHPHAMVVLFPCSLLKQGFKEATMGITSCTSSLFDCFLAPRSVARGGNVACESQHRLKSCMRMKTCMKMVTV